MAISSIAHGEMVSWMKAVPWFRQKDGRIDVEIFPPLSSSGYRSEDGHAQESALMAQASGWLEERIRMFPGQVQIDQLRAMVSRLSAESETPRR